MLYGGRAEPQGFSFFTAVKISTTRIHKNTKNMKKFTSKRFEGIVTMTGVCLLFVTTILCASCVTGKNRKVADANPVPEGFEEFAECEAHYRVFAAMPDSVHRFKIKALMTAYIDTARNTLSPKTTFLLVHSSGKTLRIECREPLMDVDSFRTFVNSNHARHNNIVVPLENKYDIEVQGDEYNLSNLDDLNLPFAFLDVSFKGYPSLLVRRDSYGGCSYYDVYGIMSDTLKKVYYEPYCRFKTATGSWMLGYGTNIDYKKKEIIIPSLAPESCSDCGTFINDCYVLDSITDQFVWHVETEGYDVCE